jgi:hypothetical protein
MRKDAIVYILAIALILGPIAGAQNSVPSCQNSGCQPQITSLQKQVQDLQTRLPVIEGWRPASPNVLSNQFKLSLTPSFAVVTLFQWDFHRGNPDLNYTLNPMPSVIVAENSTAVLQVPKQSSTPDLSVNSPCQLDITLSGTTLSYKADSTCPGDGYSAPAFNIMFVFTASSSRLAR